ncbi:MAG TPA: outer membrane protein assembly factor BamA, partial [Myxococcales bacterium]|nr:outer membrane protein assembly factor BamA [Myxococcales bacterium]
GVHRRGGLFVGKRLLRRCLFGTARCSLACLCLALGAAAHAQETSDPDAASPVEEGDAAVAAQELAGRTIREIRVAGNRRVRRESIVSVLTQSVGQAFEPSSTPADLRRVYALGQFTDVRISVEPLDAGVAYLVEVEERPVVERIRITGERALRAEEIEEVLRIERGDVVSQAELVEEAARVERLYSERGYAFTEVQAMLEPKGEGKAEVALKVQEKPRVRIEEIRFEGVSTERADELLGAIRLRETSLLTRITGTSVYTPDRVQQALERIEAFYFDRGFVQARVESEVGFDDERRRATITFRVEEGTQYRIASIGFAGTTVLSEERLRELVGSEVGALIDRSQVSADSEAIATRLQNLGYACARIVPSFERREGAEELDLTYRVEPGEKARVGKIEVTGNTSTRERVVLRELAFESGDPFTAEAIRQSIERLRALGIFNRVDIQRIGNCEEGAVGLRVEIEEGETLGYQLSFGISSDEKVVGTLLLLERNIFGTGRSASAQAQLSALRSTVALAYSEPYLFGSPGNLALDGAWSRLEYPDFTRRSLGGVVNYRLPFGRFGPRLEGFSGILAYAFQNVDIFGAPPLPPEVAPLFAGGLISSLALTAAYEAPETLQLTPRGRLLLASAELSPRFLGADIRFLRLAGVFRWSFPLPPELLLRARALLGYVDPIGDQVLPVSERFFLGGFDTLRGYRYRSIAPTIVLVDEAGRE